MVQRSILIMFIYHCTIYGIHGHTGGSVEEKRFEESDYLENGVYGSLISSSYGPLAQKGEEVLYGIDVDSTLVVYASNEIQVQSDDSIITYRYDRTGER